MKKRNPNKPMIAKDTKEPLVILGGYQVNELGGLIHKKVVHSSLPQATPDDIALFENEGLEWLADKKWFGVIDRLRNSGIINEETFQKYVFGK